MRIPLRKGKLLQMGRERRRRERFIKSNQDILKEIINKIKPSKTIDISDAYECSTITLGEYTTLDLTHRNDIKTLMKTIIDYSKDFTKKRPLNIIMQAEPGSGKSHFVKCLAERLNHRDVSAVTFNMSSLQKIDDFIQPLEAVRNLKVRDQLPILFLDEFDSYENNYSLLLPLLWDGELHIGHRELKLGKVVIILAGSSSAIKTAIKSAKDMSGNFSEERTKLIDLLSRINGGEFQIPDLDYKDDNRDRRVDKVCIAISLIRNRFGEKIIYIPWAILKFIAIIKFRYGIRSITHLIDTMPPFENDYEYYDNGLSLNALRLPLKNVNELKNSSLAYHLVSKGGPDAIVNLWNSLSTNDTLVRVQLDEEDLPFE